MLLRDSKFSPFLEAFCIDLKRDRAAEIWESILRDDLGRIFRDLSDERGQADFRSTEVQKSYYYGDREYAASYN